MLAAAQSSDPYDCSVLHSVCKIAVAHGSHGVSACQKIFPHYISAQGLVQTVFTILNIAVLFIVVSTPSTECRIVLLHVDKNAAVAAAVFDKSNKHALPVVHKLCKRSQRGLESVLTLARCRAQQQEFALLFQFTWRTGSADDYRRLLNGNENWSNKQRLWQMIVFWTA